MIASRSRMVSTSYVSRSIYRKARSAAYEFIKVSAEATNEEEVPRTYCTVSCRLNLWLHRLCADTRGFSIVGWRSGPMLHSFVVSSTQVPLWRNGNAASLCSSAPSDAPQCRVKSCNTCYTSSSTPQCTIGGAGLCNRGTKRVAIIGQKWQFAIFSVSDRM